MHVTITHAERDRIIEAASDRAFAAYEIAHLAKSRIPDGARFGDDVWLDADGIHFEYVGA